MNPMPRKIGIERGELLVEAKFVADYFLHRAREDEELISNMKLQKLLYYAQGFHLAMFDVSLFKEEIVRWMHGPVVRDLYFEYNKYGAGSIEYPAEVNFDMFTNEQLELLGEVHDVYGQFSAWALRNMTHEEPPYEQTRENQVITTALMADYFKTQVLNGER
ncbi:MAG: DUF4065 domain-containing protein [Anaerolineales bacterium]|nr:DUF4065 domain-containing protein [Anaerolineales bacterium]